MSDDPIDVSKPLKLKRPDWWSPGCGIPLPHVYAGKTYSGTGALNSGGRVWAQTQPLVWETVEEWAIRTGKS